jgi:hypothetical protein
MLAISEFLAPYAPEAGVAKTVSRLIYGYYDKKLTEVAELSAERPVRVGAATTLELPVVEHNDPFGMSFSGYLEVPADGMYVFQMDADTGGRVIVGATQVVYCGGLRRPTAGNGAIGLRAGKHAFRVEYIHGAGEKRFDVKWEGPGITLQRIPAGVLSGRIQKTP